MTESLGFRAVGQKVFIRPDPNEETTASGIIKPLAWQHPPCSGRVVACGRGTYTRRGEFVPVDLKLGDRVAYRWLDAEQITSTIEWNGEKLKVLNADQLIGVVE